MTAEERERLAASRREYVDAHFHEKSYAEMAATLGISKSSVAAMASRMGLKNGESRSRLLSGRRRKELVRRERARTAFGLEQKSRLKVTANRAKVRLRYLLRKAGYAEAGDRSTLYYGEGTARRGRLERKGAEAGRGNEAKEEDIDISEDAAAFAPSVATYDAPRLERGRTGRLSRPGRRATDIPPVNAPRTRRNPKGRHCGRKPGREGIRRGHRGQGHPGEEEPGAEGEGGAAGEVPPSRPDARTTVFPHPPLTVGDLRKKLRDNSGFSETIRMVRKAA